ncbi:hypothetical protein ACTACV_27545 [Pseudomonas syringae]|uniref:hypothetical protein n=1 Tax=Pseudomonas syringae TaxID=317 RepID=UPI003F7503FE
MKIKTGGSSITINGNTYTGRTITVTRDRVEIDGIECSDNLVGPISVVVNGNAESVETTSGNVDITGSVGRVKTMSGDVHSRPTKERANE